MTSDDAEFIIMNFYGNRFREKDAPAFIESEEFLIREEKDTWQMICLGEYYYRIREFDLALKYYEMAESNGCSYADTYLGDIWYYGRTGAADHEKAYRYYSHAASRGDKIGTYKLADMYRYGEFVEKDADRFRQFIESLYIKYCFGDHVIGECDPYMAYPEIVSRYAEIFAEAGNISEAAGYYRQAISVMEERLGNYPVFWQDLDLMEKCINELYRLIPFDSSNFGLYDLYFLFREPISVSFIYRRQTYLIACETENGEGHVCFNGKWYRTLHDFYENAMLRDEKLVVRNIRKQLILFKTEV